jgi:hypothetical protein
VVLNHEVLANLDEITSQVHRVGEVMAEITVASEQQSQGVGQLNTAVEQVNQVTQQNAANSEETASAAEEMTSQAQMMRHLVATFQLSHHDSGEEAGRYDLAPVVVTPSQRALPSAKRGQRSKHARRTTPEPVAYAAGDEVEKVLQDF